MIDEAYEQGQLVALQEIEKVAGTEFAEKVAMKMPEWASKAGNTVKGWADKAGGKAKDAYGGTKANFMSAKSGFKHTNANGTANRVGGNMGKGEELTKGQRAMEALKGGSKVLGAGGAVGGLGYGGYKAMSDDKKRR